MNKHTYNAHQALTATARMRLTPVQQEALLKAALERAEILRKLGA